MPATATRPTTEPAPRATFAEPRWIAGGGAVDSPVRQLHDRLADAFGGTLAPVPARRGLPLLARGGIVIGASIALWSVIGLIAYQVM